MNETELIYRNNIVNELGYYFNDPVTIESIINKFVVSTLSENNIPNNIKNIKLLYKPCISKLVFNKLRNNDFKDEDILTMSREELFPEKWNKLYTDRTDLLKVHKKKGAHKCPRCKSWYTTYVEVQTRSADESATVKVSCECGYKWKY